MKKILAILLTLSMIFAFAACGNKPADESTTVTEEETIENEETTTAVTTTAAPEPVTDESGEPVTNEEGETVTVEETTEETTKAPETKAEIIALYNDSINKAYAEKVGFTKERYTDNESYDMSIALKAFKGLVEKFVGIGADNKYTETVTKGKWESDAMHEYLRKSTLTEADVTSATIKEDGDNYIITLNIKNGSSVGDSAHTSSTSSLDKCGICVGNQDKAYFDHKSGPVIYDAIAGTYSGAKVNESYNNAVAVLKVNKTTGEISSFTVTFNISVGIDISIGSGTAKGTSHVIYKNFKY